MIRYKAGDRVAELKPLNTEGANGLWWRKEDCPDNMMDIMEAVRRDWDNYDDAILVMTTRGK